MQDDKVNTNKILCMVVLIIWSGALMQFTITINSSGVSLFIFVAHIMHKEICSDEDKMFLT